VLGDICEKQEILTVISFFTVADWDSNSRSTDVYTTFQSGQLREVAKTPPAIGHTTDTPGSVQKAVTPPLQQTLVSFSIRKEFFNSLFFRICNSCPFELFICMWLSKPDFILSI